MSEDKKPSNKRFYLIGFVLLLVSLGATYMLTGGSEEQTNDTPTVPADQGIRLP
jgi:hypothetical protein